MLEAIYEIGKLQTEDFLEGYIEDIGESYKHLIKIQINIDKMPKYSGVSFEEIERTKRLKYFYKKGSANGIDITPVSRITQIDKTFKIKILPYFKEFEKIAGNLLNDNEKNLVSQIDKCIRNNKEKILKDIKKVMKDNGMENEKNAISITFIQNGIEKYIGDMDIFKRYVKSKESDNTDFYKKYNKISKADNKLCYYCKKKKEVYGFVSTFAFYTMDKRGFVTGGDFDQSLAWRGYPVCGECANILEAGKKYIEKNLSYKFAGFDYYLIPQILFYNKASMKVVLKIADKIRDASLTGKDAKSNIKAEERILRELAKEKNNVCFNFLFYRVENSAFKILLFLQEVSPSRLSYIISKKDEVDKRKCKYDIFTPIKTAKGDVLFDMSFPMLREFFPANKYEGTYDKEFLAILNAIFMDKTISFSFLLNRIMEKIRNSFVKRQEFGIMTKKGYKIILYLIALNILDIKIQKGGSPMDSNKYEDFFKENSIFDDDTKKAVFLEGVLVANLLDIQYRERNSKPFYSRLNGLKIDEHVVKRLLPEAINKLEEYNENYYRSLEEVIAKYMLKSDFSKYSVDEISFYFTLGMTLNKLFKENKEEEE